MNIDLFDYENHEMITIKTLKIIENNNKEYLVANYLKSFDDYWNNKYSMDIIFNSDDVDLDIAFYFLGMFSQISSELSIFKTKYKLSPAHVMKRIHNKLKNEKWYLSDVTNLMFAYSLTQQIGKDNLIEICKKYPKQNLKFFFKKVSDAVINEMNEMNE